MKMMRLGFCGRFGAGLLLSLAGAPLMAQAPGAAPPPVIDMGDTAWMLAASALVLLMTPGLALFYGGMVRAKNVLGTMMHSIFCMGLISVQWVLFGYTLAFGTDTAGGFIGGLDHLFLRGVSHEQPLVLLGTTYKIPVMAFMVFQMMFAIITPALITGAFAERVRFVPYALFMLLWSTLVYDPIAHWVWGGGLLANVDGSWLKNTVKAGALDFAGGTVVHLSSGISALVFCLMITKRRGYPKEPILPNNLVLTVLGAGLLWFGWFGFNGGSGLVSGAQATLAFTVTHICAATAALAWAVIEWLHRGKASILGVATGLVAGLVCITPASGFVLPMPALFMGIIVAAVCYFAVAILKAKLGYDDSLDAFGVHGVGGATGAILTGAFCSVYGGTASGQQVLAQVIAVAVTIVYAVVVTWVIVFILQKTIGIRASDEEEETGLDVTQHGEVGYNL